MKITASFDPVSRIEGHLGVEVEFDTVNGVQQVVNVRASGLLFRGFENILIGRDPRDAPLITQRICGVCPVAHGMAAVTALDEACGVTVPANARILRNLVNAANFIESHILHFYLLALPGLSSRDRPCRPGRPTGASTGVSTPRPRKPSWPATSRPSRSGARPMRWGPFSAARCPIRATYVAGGFTANPRPERIAAFETT